MWSDWAFRVCVHSVCGFQCVCCVHSVCGFHCVCSDVDSHVDFYCEEHQLSESLLNVNVSDCNNLWREGNGEREREREERQAGQRRGKIGRERGGE